MTSSRDIERWKKRPAIALTAGGDFHDVPPLRIPDLGLPTVKDFDVVVGGKLFLPSFRWFNCVACCYCELHVRRSNLKDHLRRHDETKDRQLVRDEYKVGNRHRTHPKQQKLMV